MGSPYSSSTRPVTVEVCTAPLCTCGDGPASIVLPPVASANTANSLNR